MTEVYYFNYSLNGAKFFSKISHIPQKRNLLRNSRSWEGSYQNLTSLSAFSSIPSSSRSRRQSFVRACQWASRWKRRKAGIQNVVSREKVRGKRKKKEREGRGWRGGKGGKAGGEGRGGTGRMFNRVTFHVIGRRATRSHARDHASALPDTCAQCARRGATRFHATATWPVRWHRRRVRFIAAYAETAPFA